MCSPQVLLLFGSAECFFFGFCSCSFSLAHFVFGFCYVLPWSLGRDDYKIHIHTYKKKGKKIYVSWRVMCLVFVCLQCMTPKKNCDSRHAYAFSVKQTCVHIKQRRRHTTMNNNNNNNQINLSYSSRAAAKKNKMKKKMPFVNFESLATIHWNHHGNQMRFIWENANNVTGFQCSLSIT